MKYSILKLILAWTLMFVGFYYIGEHSSYMVAVGVYGLMVGNNLERSVINHKFLAVINKQIEFNKRMVKYIKENLL